ncbi:MAG: hypothetical protein ACRDHF_01050 [Tepidiformaceae bacterium]
MTVTHVRYDEQSFRSVEDCLAEIARRLDDGWFLSEVSPARGRVRAVFGWHATPEGSAGAPVTAVGGAR